MPRLGLALAALFGAVFPATAQDAVLSTLNVRGAISFEGVSYGIYQLTPRYYSFDGVEVGSTTDPDAPVINPSLTQMTLPAAFFRTSLANATYWINPPSDPGTSTPVTASLLVSAVLPDPRVPPDVSTDPYPLQRFDFPSVSLKLTVTSDADTGLRSIRYNGGATGTDALSGTPMTFTTAGAISQAADNTWSYSDSWAIRDTTIALVYTGKSTGEVIVPVPEPATVLLLGSGVVAIAAARRRPQPV